MEMRVCAHLAPSSLINISLYARGTKGEECFYNEAKHRGATKGRGIGMRHGARTSNEPNLGQVGRNSLSLGHNPK